MRRLSEVLDKSNVITAERPSESDGDLRARQRRTLSIPQEIADAVRRLDWGRRDAVMRALDMNGTEVREGKVPPVRDMGALQTWPVSIRLRQWRRVEQIADQRDWSCSQVVSALLARMPELDLRADRDEL